MNKKVCLSLHYSGVNSYIFVNGVETYKFKAEDSKMNAAPLCLGTGSEKYSVDNIKRLDYADISMSFQSIMIILTLLIFWIYIIFNEKSQYKMSGFIKKYLSDY